jgi:ribosomal protein S18 acetylase RimI-like enzyme
VSNNIIRLACREDFEIISRLIANQSKQPETHCIQSDTGEEYQSIQRELVQLDLSSALCFVAAFQDDQLIGALGSELDEELGRGWLRGPFIVASTDDWDSAASALLEGLVARLPPAIHWLDSFLNIANTRGNEFYLNHGFHQLRLAHVYVAAAPKQPVDLARPCETLTPQQAQAFIALHQAVFPQTYATGQRILDKLGDDHQVFVYTQSGELLGYLYAAIEEDSGDGSVEFVGVRADARGRGIGRQLLHTALRWFFEVKQVPQATLVVNDNLTNARSLYEKVGFGLKYTGVHARKEW